MAVGSTNYAFPMPDQGLDPWTNAFYALINAMDAKLLANEPPAGKTLKWGLVTAGHHVEAVAGGSAVGYVGAHDRKNGSFKNLAAEVVAAVPPAGANDFDGRMVFKDKLWVCRDGAGSLYTPLTRPTLVVGTDAKTSEYATLAAAVAAVPAAGATIVVMPGTHLVANKVQVPAKTTIVGMGGAIVSHVANADAHAFEIDGKADVRIEGLTFLGGAGKHAIQIQAAGDASLKDVTIEGCSFDGGVSGVIASGAFIHRRITIRNCRFSGTDAISGSAVSLTSKLRDVRIEDCSFDNWGEAGANQRTVNVVSADVGLQGHFRNLTFDANGQQVGVAETDLHIENMQDVIISGISSRSAGGAGMKLLTVSRAAVSDVSIRSPADAGVILDTVVDSAVSDVVVSGAADDGWRIVESNIVGLVRCVSMSSGAVGFELGANNAHLVFEACQSRGSVGDDLNLVVSTTNCRLGFVLSKAPGGTISTTNGRKVSKYIPFDAWKNTVGAAVYTTIGATAWAGWAFDSINAETIAGSWEVPSDILPQSDINLRAWYVGAAGVPIAGDDVAIRAVVLNVAPGVTKVTDADVTKDVVGQTVTVQNQVERSAAMTFVAANWGAAGRVLLIQLSRQPGLDDQYAVDVHVVALEAEVTVTDVEVVA